MPRPPNNCYISELFWVLFGIFDVFQKTLSRDCFGRRRCRFWCCLVAAK